MQNKNIDLNNELYIKRSSYQCVNIYGQNVFKDTCTETLILTTLVLHGFEKSANSKTANVVKN